MKRIFFAGIFSIFSFYFSFSQSSQKIIDSLKLVYKEGKTSNENADALNSLIDQYFDRDKDSAETYILKTLKFTDGKKYF